MDKLGQTLIDDYGPPEISIDCFRCRRHAHVTIATLRKKFGNQRLDVVARMVARAATDHSRGPCGLADDPFKPLCSARPIEVDPVGWANIHHAEQGGWRAILHCRRRLENLKRTKSCAETVQLPVLVLKAMFGWDFALEKLPRHLRCPHCLSRAIEIEWIFPAEAPDPGGTTNKEAPVLRLRPTRAEIGRGRFRVIESRGERARGGSKG